MYYYMSQAGDYTLHRRFHVALLKCHLQASVDYHRLHNKTGFKKQAVIIIDDN